MARTGPRGAYIVHEKGPGYCRNGHHKPTVGVYEDRRGGKQCLQCLTENKARQYANGRGAQVIRKRAANAIIAAPEVLDADVAEMRARAVANACRDCGAAGSVETVVGRLCYPCKGRRVEGMRRK